MQDVKRVYNVSHPHRRRNDFDMLKFVLESEKIEVPESEILAIPNLNDGKNKLVEIAGLKIELIHSDF